MRRRLEAIAALGLGAAGIVLAIANAVSDFPLGLIALACALLGIAAAGYGVLRRGTARRLGIGAGVVLFVIAIVLVIASVHWTDLVALAALAAALALGRAVFEVRVALPAAKPPQQPVLFYNPKSGGGKAEKFNLAGEARDRGIEPVELQRGDDLETLVRDAVAHGADGLAMAGGDGSQAIVAAVAAEEGLPYACIPAGTRNHFALDLGVDREDVVGALDAFVDGGWRRVDLAEVNDRVFVNNVSLGVYAEAVQRSGYREAKVRTLLETVPDVLGGDGEGRDLTWTGPDGHEHSANATILVSNNPYRLGRAIGSGTRPRIDDGLLGIAALDLGAGSSPSVVEWSAASVEIRAGDDRVPAGIDGESVVLHPPLRFGIRPGVLEVRVARAHPGASPSAHMPDRMGDALRALARIAAGG
jgi:diacylglycerol kinase family enzyme